VIFPYQDEALLRRTKTAAENIVESIKIAVPLIDTENPGTEKLGELIKRRELNPADGELRFRLPFRGPFRLRITMREIFLVALLCRNPRSLRSLVRGFRPYFRNCSIRIYSMPWSG
jgi:hypothetical protein